MTTPIFDAHTHLFSRVFFETLAKGAPEERSVGERLAAVTARTGIEIPPIDPLETGRRWIGELDRAGVDRAITFASVPEEAPAVSQVVAASAGRLVGCTVTNASAPGGGAFVEKALGELGMRGVVLFPSMHHYHLSEEICRPVLASLARSRALCFVHCGILKIPLRDLLGLPRTFDARFSSPLSIVRAANEFPEVTFVIPHFGAGLFRETLLAGSWCPNILVDTSSSNEWRKIEGPGTSLEEIFRRALDVFGPERILFGTDSSTFPRGYRSDLLGEQREILERIGLGEEDRGKILGGNLARILG